MFLFSCFTSAVYPEITWDETSMLVNSHRVIPVMGEMHYSRVPANQWRSELHKMHEGGVNIVATYVFWIHHEEVKGQYDWLGQRDLRHFLQSCDEEGMKVVLRIGPFAHGETRNGGFPDWMVNSEFKLRSDEPAYLEAVRTWYQNIGQQCKGMMSKDGGPVIGIQLENEFRGRGEHLMMLKKMAQEAGLVTPFYTYTGWPGLKTPVPYGEMLPLYGDYPDGFWSRSDSDMPGDYYQAFYFKPGRTNKVIASEQIDYGKLKTEKNQSTIRSYPYLTCELGGGMASSYMRRIHIDPMDIYSIAVVKLGSGSNLLGYYMYHGGTNPEGKLTTLNENRLAPSCNHNDLPVKSYDFQSPLGEFGQVNPHYFMLRKLHLFLRDYGEMLAPMQPVFPQPGQTMEKGGDSLLRWSYRTDGRSGFVFVNNYERMSSLSPKTNIRFDVGTISFPRNPITIPAATACIFPYNISFGELKLKYATAQLICRLKNGRYTDVYFEKIKGIPATFSFEKMQILEDVRIAANCFLTKGNTRFFLFDSDAAGRIGIDERVLTDVRTTDGVAIDYDKISSASILRQIPVADGWPLAPADSDFADADVWKIKLPQRHVGHLLDIGYVGDVARLYVNGKLVDDNYYNGDDFLYDLNRLPADCKELELRIIPLQRSMRVYLHGKEQLDYGNSPSASKVDFVRILTSETMK